MIPKAANKKHSTMKISPHLAKKDDPIEYGETKPASDFKSHEAAKFIKDTLPSHAEFKKFATLLYRGLYYSVNNLKGPS